MNTEKRKLPLALLICFGIVAGIIWAIFSIQFGLNQFTLDYIKPFGTIFLRFLKMIAIPMVMFSIMTGVFNLKDIKRLGRLGGKTLGIYLCTTLLAVGIGLIYADLGFNSKPESASQEQIDNRIRYELWAKQNNIPLADKKSFLTDPKYKKMVEGVQKSDGEYHSHKIQNLKDNYTRGKQRGPLQPLVDVVPDNVITALGSDKLMLQVITFSIFFAICALLLKDETAAPMVSVFNSINETLIMMINVLMKGAPFFVFALMAGVLAETADSFDSLLAMLQSLLKYSFIVLAGLISLVLIYTLVTKIFVKRMGWTFIRRALPAQMVAFSTSSSAGTLPVTIETVEKRLGASKSCTSFVLPIGATVNMDGTSLYQAVAILFLADMHLIDLSIAQQLTVVATATLASIGSAAIPSAGLVMLMMVLSSVGLNPAWVVFILPIDRILDMCRTVVNVTGDMMVTTIVANSEGEFQLVKMDHLEDKYDIPFEKLNTQAMDLRTEDLQRPSKDA
ncbi:MAG: dicarboxylate/amino acid:cation symporter [Lentisphaeria bacterium]|nr:dicarboxylate/amino acid:cation symporter [Lentisphaeria bacterium]